MTLHRYPEGGDPGRLLAVGCAEVDPRSIIRTGDVAMRIGSLFSGYGGLDLAVAAHYGASVAWHAEIEPAACRVLEARSPRVPNVGDVSRVDWSEVEPVDVLTGGFPCQDVSHAGKRAGVRPGTRSGLWSHMAHAISVLRPRLVVIENVAGLLSAEAAGDVEPCPWCVGDEPAGVVRALGAVLADLAKMGFDADWGSVRASEAGAAHRRERVFIVASDASRERLDGGWATGTRGPGEPTNSDHEPVTLLPTPAVNDMGAGKSVEAWDDWTDAMKAKHGNGNGHGKSLAIEAQRLLPTPKASDGPNGGPGMRNGRGVRDSLPGVVPLLPTPTSSQGRNETSGRQQDAKFNTGTTLQDVAYKADFGPYAAAIARWESVIGRPAPSPTEPNKDGRPRLSPRFVEWLMGLPDGWVTDAGISRAAQLKCLGNGVVPQQALLALRLLEETP